MQSNSPNRKRLLRPEACVLHEHQLDESQRRAFTSIMEMLEEAIDGLDSLELHEKRTTGTLLPWFGFYRENRVVLLHGARGTGKTSVMLSLIHACTQNTVLTNEMEKKFRCRTIWLEPLDMEPLPGPTNLLAAILARIGASIKLYIPQPAKKDDCREPRGILELCPGYLDAFQKLQCLQAEVALAWEGNMSERGAHLDPDTYSMETIRAEHARLSLNRNLSDTLDDLAKNVSMVCGVTNPIFVLPVDDLDLNPTRCLEILRLLRMINTPRLFILVLGDLNMIEIVLSLKHTGDFMNVAGDSGSRSLENFERAYIRKNVGKVAFNVMRKLLPPEQRIHLRPMQVWEALNYRPPESGSENQPRLHKLLAKWPVTIDAINPNIGPFMSDGSRIKSLWDFLLFPVSHPYLNKAKNTIANEKLEKININECCYNARAILRASPRHIADWWSFLQKIDEPSYGEVKDEEGKKKIEEEWRKKRSHEFIDGLGHHCRSTIGEDPRLSLMHRQKYRDALRKSGLTGEWELFLGITSIPEIGPAERVTLPADDGIPSSIKKKFSLCPGKGWRLYPGDSELSAQIESLPLVETKKLKEELDRFEEQSSFSDGTASALLLFHDLLALGPEAKLTRKNIKMYRPIEQWAMTEWEIGSLGVSIFWPVPSFLSSWGYDTFLSYWNQAINELSKIKDEQERLTYSVYAWIDSATAVVLRERPLLFPMEKKERSLKCPELEDWQNLSIQADTLLTKILAKEDLRGVLVKEWLRRLLNFLMPEVTGIQKEFVECFRTEKQRKELTLSEFWNGCESEVKQFRKEIFKRFKEMGMEDSAIEKLDTMGVEYAETMGINLRAETEPSIPPSSKAGTKRNPKSPK